MKTFEQIDLDRWNDPKQRQEIENAIMTTIKSNDDKRIGFLLWCVEGSPWEEWTKLQIITRNRVKSFLELIPKFA